MLGLDMSLEAFKQSLTVATDKWTNINQNKDQLLPIAYAFLLSRILFLQYLIDRDEHLTPTQFLIHQLFNSKEIKRCFRELEALPLQELEKIRETVELDCIVCVDEAHVLRNHLSDVIISSDLNSVQKNESKELCRSFKRHPIWHICFKGVFADTPYHLLRIITRL